MMEENESVTLGSGDNGAQELRVVTSFALAVCMALCCLVGLFGNVISAIIFLHPLMRSPINVLLAGLSLIDLSMILLSVLVFVMPNLNLMIQNATLWKAFPATAVFLYPLLCSSHTSSIYTFVLVSIERYNATCKPLKPHKLLTCRQARLAQTFVVILALCYNSVRMWEYRDISRNSTEHISGVEPYLRLRIDYFISYYTCLYILTHFIVPFTVITILNIFIIRSVRYTDRYLMARTVLASPGHSRQAKQQRNTTNMIVVITILFTLCNVCPFALNIWEAFDPGLFYGEWQTKAYLALDLSNTFVLFNSSITFVVYITYCRRYRLLFRYFVRFPCCCPASYAAAFDLASDPTFRRYSVVTNSGCDTGLEMTAVVYAFYTKRRASTVEHDGYRVVAENALRRTRNSKTRRLSAFPQPLEFRSRVLTQ